MRPCRDVDGEVWRPKSAARDRRGPGTRGTAHRRGQTRGRPTPGRAVRVLGALWRDDPTPRNPAHSTHRAASQRRRPRPARAHRPARRLGPHDRIRTTEDGDPAVRRGLSGVAARWGVRRSGVDHGWVGFRAQGRMTLQYVLAAVAVPLATMSAMLIMERLEHHVLGAPAAVEEDRRGASSPAVPPASPVEHTNVVETPRAA